jgi:hypothetical protein
MNSDNPFPLLVNCKTTKLVQMTEVLRRMIPFDFLFYLAIEVNGTVRRASIIEELRSIKWDIK